MNTVVIIQARLTSSRLPGKVLKPIGPVPAISHTISRAGLTGFKPPLAVPDGQQWEIIDALWPRAFGPMPVYAGPEDDVLGRMAAAAMAEHADIVVRLTGDCPFVDPRMVWTCAYGAAQHNCYVANCGVPTARGLFPRTEPRGLDVEAFPMWALIDADLYATEPLEREHVTPWIRANVACLPMKASTNRPDLRWLLDTQEDYEWFCKLAAMIDCTPPHPTTRELLAFLKEHPEMERKDESSPTVA